MVRVLWFLGQNLAARHVIIVLVEGELAAEERVENDPQAPHVHLLAGVLLPLEHFRRRVTYRAAERLEMVGSALVFSREAEIDELDILVLVEEDILELEIAVDA